MAEIAVGLLLERLSSLIVEEGKLLGGVGEEVNDLRRDLETMKSFLRDADSRGGETNEEGFKTWVKQVRDVAFDTEDVLDEFLLRLVRPRKHGIFNYLVNMLHDIKNLNTCRDLASEVQNIKARLQTISSRRGNFSVTDNGEGSRANTIPKAWKRDPREESLYLTEAEIVGIEVPKNKLIGWLTVGELELMIISVVGMGGLGKTTLVKKVYESQTVKKHFDCHAWVTVSKSFVIGELLRATIKEVLKATKQQASEGMDAMNYNELIEELNNQLCGKRYVIIFDDIWDINVWETIKFSFPTTKCGSRIIFTTRIRNVTRCSNYVHDLEPLKEQDEWRLFCMKAFGSKHGSSRCPIELEGVSRHILKKCKGLPLAIVLIGGLLATKNTVLEWNNILDTLGAEMKTEGALESFSRILLLSYNNLPYYLKPCYLYLSMFPEDYFIKRMMLIRLWIAEGFIEEKQGVTVEVVAGDYVDELISRSMIQIAELNRSNEVKSCRIHDLMRETILLKSKEECFSTTTITNSQEGMGVGLHEMARRISIYHNNNTGDENYISYPMGSKCSHIRSLMMFQLDKSPRSFGNKLFRAFRLLRVLDLEKAPLVKFPPELVELIHLRYLSLRNTPITLLPKSVGKLKNLETLDLKQTRVSELPVEILKLQRLRHLLVYRSGSDLVYSGYTYGVSVPTEIGNLTSLQKLTFLDVQHQAARDSGVVLKELKKLTQLKKLGITNLRSKDGTNLCVALEKMKHMSSLNITRSTTTTTTTNVNKDEDEFLELESLMSPPRLLRRLYLNGRLMRLPVWIASLRNLIVLALFSSRLSCEEDEPLKAFQHMPNLVCLYLQQAYDGEELCCSEVGGYKKLKTLFLNTMEGLKRVRLMQGSMPMLRELRIKNCPALEMVPQGIEHLSGLQKLGLFGLHPGLVERIRKRPISQVAQGEGEGEGGGEDYWRVKHIPKYYHIFRNTEGTLVDDKLQ